MKTILIDGNSLMYRAYFGTAYSGVMKNSSGTPVNAILTFHNMIFRIIQNYNPTHILVAFDAGKKTRRHEKLASYKAGRASTPPELIIQFPLAKKMLDLMGIARKELSEIEADDIIASMASKLQEDDNQVMIVSSDRDLFQMVSKQVSIVVPQNSSKPDLVVTNDNFLEVFGCYPYQVPDLKAIMGDSSDNLDGVKGIGEKGALKLVNEFGSLEKIYENIDSFSDSVKTKLINSKEMAFLCKELATLDRNVELELSHSDLKYSNKISQELIDYFMNLEINSLVKKYKHLVDKKILGNIVF